PGIQTMPAWSPKGDRIAYASEVGSGFQVFVRKVGAPLPAQVTHQDGSCYFPFWAPDGTRVYYVVNRGGVDWSLWSIGIAGGQAEKLFDGVKSAALTPDGKTLIVGATLPDNTFATML